VGGWRENRNEKMCELSSVFSLCVCLVWMGSFVLFLVWMLYSRTYIVKLKKRERKKETVRRIISRHGVLKMAMGTLG